MAFVSFLLLHHLNSTQLVQFFMHAFEICALLCQTNFLEFNERGTGYYIFKINLLKFSSAITKLSVIQILTEDNYIYFVIG